MKSLRYFIIIVIFTFIFVLSTLPVTASEPVSDGFIVGKDNKLTVSLKGSAGLTGGLGQEVEEVNFDYYFTKENDGNFFAESSTNTTNDIKIAGKTDITIFADKPGMVGVVFAFKIIYKDNVKPTRILTEQFTFNFVPETEKRTLAFMYVGSPESPSPFSAQIKDDKMYLPVDITMQILGAAQTLEEENIIIHMYGIDFINEAALADKYKVKIEKVSDEKGNVVGIRIVQYVEK